MMTSNSIEVAGTTDPGCVRPNNEDNFVVDEELGLLVVADGMGGHNSGEVASDLACKTIREMAQKMLGGAQQIVPEGGDPKASARARQLEFFVKHANSIIHEKGRSTQKEAGMGTTVVAALCDGQSMTVAHVGDSRLYLYRGGQLQALTEDHSLVGDQVKRGMLTPAEAAKSTLQNILTRALGAEKEVQVDVADHPLMPGDVVLLASDGLTKMVDDADVAKTIEREPSAKAIVDSLIDQAKKAGGVDNVTVVVARVSAGGKGGMKGFLSGLFGK